MVCLGQSSGNDNRQRAHSSNTLTSQLNDTSNANVKKQKLLGIYFLITYVQSFHKKIHFSGNYQPILR